MAKEKVIPMKEWLQTFRGAADELARTSLRFDPGAAAGAAAKGGAVRAAAAKVGAKAAADEDGEPGAYIAVLSPNNAIHLGLSARPSQCQALARALLGLRHDEPIAEADVMDSVSEVMNILAGKVKASMAGRDGELHLGLPMFVQNPVQASAGSEAEATEVKLGPVECTLRVYRRQRAA
jgi:hypothetical protein